MDQELENRYKEILYTYAHINDASYWYYYLGKDQIEYYKNRYAALTKDLDKEDYEIWKFNYLENEYQKQSVDTAWVTCTYTTKNGTMGPFTETVVEDGFAGFMDWLEKDCEGALTSKPVPATKEDVKNTVIAYECMGIEDEDDYNNTIAKFAENAQKYEKELLEQLHAKENNKEEKKN